MVVRAMAVRIVRVLFFVLCLTGLLSLTAASAFAAADVTKTVVSGTAKTTGITACDANANAQSCLEQRVDFTATVTDTNSSPNGSPLGNVAFVDENGVTIGFGGLTANGDGVSSSAVFETAILTATGSPHTVRAQYLNDLSGQWGNSTGTTSWTIVARPTSVAVNTTSPTVVGTVKPLSAAVTDLGPAPVAIDKSGSAVAAGSFFLATDGNLPTPNVLTLKTARYGEAGAAMPNGSVLIVGGSDGTTVLKSAELIGNTVTASGSTLATARIFPTATTGVGGNVIIAGGSTDQCMSAADLTKNGKTSNSVQNSLEKYSFQTDAFGAVSTSPPTITARCGHAAVRLPNGTIAFIGGYDATGAAMNSIEVFDGNGNGGHGSVSSAGNLTTARAGAVAVVLQSGSVLIAGGDATGDAEVWDGSSTTTTAAIGTMTVPRMFAAGSIMSDGNVFIAGGFSASDSTEMAVASAEIYDVANTAFSAISATLLNAAGTAAGPGKEFASVLVADGVVGFAGGRDDANAVLGTIQAYAPANTPAGVVNFSSSDATDDLGGTGNPTGVSCTLDVANGTSTVACTTLTITSYHARHVDTTHTVTGAYAGSTNSATSSGATNVTVTPTTLTVTANSQTRTYGASHTFSTAACTIVVTPGVDCIATGLLTGDNVTVTFVSPANNSHQPVGTILGDILPTSPVITPGQLADYIVTTVPGNMTVTPAHLTVTADAKSKTYDTTPFTTSLFTATITGLQNGETLATGGVTGTAAFTGTAITGVNAGPYTITPTLGTLAATNYDFPPANFVNGVLTITPAHLTITADPKSKPYDGAVFSGGFTAVISGFVGGQTLGTSGVTGAPGFTGAATTQVNAGSWAIVPTVGTLVASNYDFPPVNFISAQLTIIKDHLTVTANNQTRIYGAANPTFTFVLSGFVNGENATTASVSGNPTITTTAVATSSVAGSPYTITVADAGTLSATNYDFPSAQFVNAQLTITRAHLGVTADSKMRAYGSPNPALTFTLIGFANAENATTAGVTGSPTLTTPAVVTSGVAGSPYLITVVDAGTLAAPNYDFPAASFVNGQFVVVPAHLTVTADPQTKTYDTATFTAFTATITGFANSETLASSGVTGSPVFTGSAVTGISPGSYSIIPVAGTLTAVNYDFPAADFVPATLTVNQATTAVRAEQLTTKIDPTTGGIVLTLKVFLFNSTVPGAVSGTGKGTPTGSVDVFDGTNKLTSTSITLSPDTSSGQCSALNPNCGSEASFVSAAIPLATSTTHKIDIAYAGDTNFAAGTVQVGSFSVAASNAMGGANIPPMTSNSSPIQIPNPEPLLTGQKYTLTCAIYSVTTGAQMQATSGTCTTSAGTGPVDLTTNPSFTVSVNTEVATSELRMRRLYDLSLSMPAFVLVGAGVPLLGLRRKTKRGKLVAWLGITLALGLCLVAVGCGGNGFKNPNNVPVITQNSAQAGQYTIIVTAENTSSQNRFDVAAVPFSVSQ